MKSIVALFLLLFLVAYIPLNAQMVSSPQESREEFFSRMEQRAASLAQKMSELSGKEIPTASSTFDQLDSTVPESPGLPPAPSATNLKDTGGMQGDNGLLLMESPPDDPGAERYEIVPTMQDTHGKNYLLPFVSLSVPSDVLFSKTNGGTDVNFDVENERGYGLGFKIGRRFENWDLGVELNYNRFSYEGQYRLQNFDVGYTGNGDVLFLFAHGGLSLPIRDYGWLRAGLGLGLGSRTQSLTHKLGLSSSPSVTSESTFAYNFNLSFGYDLTEKYNFFVGYQFQNTGDMENYESLSLHLFQTGLMTNF